MRITLNALLALPALLSVLVVAVPSPAAYFQQPLNDPTPGQQTRWRSISDRLIESIWGIEQIERDERRQLLDSAKASRHTLARYGGDVVLRFNITTEAEARSLADAANTLLLDIWDFTHNWVDIRLSKDIVSSLLGLLPYSLQHSHAPLLHERELAYAIHNTYSNAQEPSAIKPTSSHLRDRQFTPLLHPAADGVESSAFFREYRSLSVIEPWMRLISRIFSTHVQLVNIGLSYEGRDILGLRVGVHPTNDDDPQPRKRKTVLVTGGLHAREWISTSTVNFVAFNTITSYGKTASITTLLEEFDFVFIPTVNPDGYVYTWETDRLWRKNRQQTTVRFCQGIDLDKGFGFAWDGLRTAGNPCSESYNGDTPFEAVESRRLADWAKNETTNNNVEFVGFLDLHSYSQQILYPYSYSCDDVPPSHENLEELATGLEKAIRRSSSVSYEPMAACEGNFAVNDKSTKRTTLPRIEESGGSAIDWFYHELHVRYAYQIKLRDQGTYGFLLPKENIVPTGKEILDAVLYFAEFLSEGYPKQSVDDKERAEPDLPADAGLTIEGEAEPDSPPDVLEESKWDLRRRRKR